MPTYDYKGQRLSISDSDSEYKGYFEAAEEHRLVVRKCLACGKMRAEPGPACPWCPSREWEWVTVSGKGTIYSFQVVAHTVLPGFRDWAPFAIVLVELDEQRGQPDPGDGLRIVGNLLDADMEPEKEENVAIGKRVEVLFMDLEDGLTLPQWKLSDEPAQGPVWHGPA